MKKILLIFTLALMLSFLFWRQLFQRHESTLAQGTANKSSSSDPVKRPDSAGNVSGASKRLPSTSAVDKGLLRLTLNHKLDPASLEAYAEGQGLAVHREILGHPRSGQRLVLRIDSIPESIAVFDVLKEGGHQLSAVRANFPRGADMKALKDTLKSAVNRPIDREDERSLVFKSDDEGLVVWLGQNEDGSIKLASEYMSHEHP